MSTVQLDMISSSHFWPMPPLAERDTPFGQTFPYLGQLADFLMLSGLASYALLRASVPISALRASA